MNTTSSLSTLWSQPIGFELKFAMKYQGMWNNSSTGPQFPESTGFVSKIPNHIYIENHGSHTNMRGGDVTRDLLLWTPRSCWQVKKTKKNCGSHQSLGDAWVSCHTIEYESLIWQTKFHKNYHKQTAWCDRKPRVYCGHYGASSDHRLVNLMLCVTSRAFFLLGVGRDDMSYWVYDIPSFPDLKNNDFHHIDTYFLLVQCSWPNM